MHTNNEAVCGVHIRNADGPDERWFVLNEHDGILYSKHSDGMVVNSYTYNDRGFLVTLDHADGSATMYDYDDRGCYLGKRDLTAEQVLAELDAISASIIDEVIAEHKSMNEQSIRSVTHSE